MATRFTEGMKRANLATLSVLNEPVTVNGYTIMAAVDDLSQTSYARSGGKSPGVESALFVNEDEFKAAGGKKGSIIKFEDGKTVGQVQQISDFQGVLYLQIAPFRP